MVTIHSYDHNSNLQRHARSKALQISSNKEKGLIKVNCGGIIIIIDDASISSCVVEDTGQLAINANDGRRIIFKAETKSDTIKLLARLNRALAGSNCDLRFELPMQRNPLSPSLLTTDNSQSKKTNSLRLPAVISGLIMSVFTILIIIASNSANNTESGSADGPPVVDDAWEARLRKERESWYKQQDKTKAHKQTASSTQDNHTEIASIIVSVSCAGNKGLIPRGQMGSMMKEMFQDKGINSTRVYDNWDYYWGLAKEMDSVNKTYCLK